VSSNRTGKLGVEEVAVNSTSEDAVAIDTAIAGLYQGPLQTFVARRDSLAKDLRGSGDREAASAVKALRKPSLAAWALNLAVVEKPDAMGTLIASIRETVAAQSSGAGAGGAISDMRAAVRRFADEAARAAADAGHDLDGAALAAALFAVLGNTESFDALRRGRLADVPEAGGLDLLALVPTLTTGDSVAPPPRKSRTERPAAAGSPVHDAEQEVARSRVQEAAAALASAKARNSHALEALRDAEAAVVAAEARVRAAEDEAREANSHRDRAQRQAAAAAAGLERAEATAAEAERQLRRP
jgi:hypothetical protein